MTKGKLIEAGVRVGDLQMAAEDKIWSRYSNDKVDIGEQLARVLRLLHKAFPLAPPLRALSIGSSAEPQFRLLQTAFAGGLYLLDIEQTALDVVRERSGKRSPSSSTAASGRRAARSSRSRTTLSFLAASTSRGEGDLIFLTQRPRRLRRRGLAQRTQRRMRTKGPNTTAHGTLRGRPFCAGPRPRIKGTARSAHSSGAGYPAASRSPKQMRSMSV